ncbi:MAG: ribonuclease R [Gemmatimonadota bacterium]|nr:ribonuclease R [Gemmatimonadota bacterium]
MARGRSGGRGRGKGRGGSKKSRGKGKGRGRPAPAGGSGDPYGAIPYLSDEAGRPLKPKELAREMEIPKDDYSRFRDSLRDLVRSGALYHVRGGRLAAPKDLGLVIGRLQTIESGAGFVIPDEGDEDVYVRQRDLGTAVDGDRVTVRVEQKSSRGRGGSRRGPRGRVIEVLERAFDRAVGVLHVRKSYGWVDVVEPRLEIELYVPGEERGDAGDGDLVVVEITSWGDDEPAPVGRVERVLGRPGDPGADILAIQIGYGLPEDFPPSAEEEANRLAERGVTDRDLEGREDFRELRVVTVDPADARDHDDALSIERLDDGSVWVGVHIADVSQFVTARSSLDEEAWERATSVYLVDRVIPMLPHALSSDLCSLVPGEDRLTLSALLRVGSDGELMDARFAKSVIRSTHRLSYQRAQTILEGGDDEAVEADPELRRDLRDLHRVSRAFRKRRRKRGSLDFDLPESRVELDEEGVPIDVHRVIREPAHELVEDLMIAANEAVARWTIEEGVPALYRIHEEPPPEKLENVQALAAEFDLSFPSKNARPRDFQRLLDAVEGEPEEPTVAMAVLRSLAQARYAPSNDGHFGLASQAYLHFTSPIRRYPDLVVHRQLSAWLDDPASARRLDPGWLDATAKHASARERRAVEAERDSVELKKVEFMERHVGDHFEATVSGVASFGFFVRLVRYDIEGLVHVSEIGDDYYQVDPVKHALVGRRTKRAFRLGDEVTIQVVRVDREERKIDFTLVED